MWAQIFMAEVVIWVVMEILSKMSGLMVGEVQWHRSWSEFRCGSWCGWSRDVHREQKLWGEERKRDEINELDERMKDTWVHSEANELVDFWENVRFCAFPASDSELRKWTVSCSAAKLLLQQKSSVFPQCGGVKRLDFMLCHSRDVHPTWVKSFTKTLSNEVPVFWVLSTKSEEDLESS